MPVFVKANEATAARRRVYFHLVLASDGISPATGEAAGQPQISTNGGAWTGVGIGTLTAIGNGRYYADLTQAAVANAGDEVETRYKGTLTAECPGESVRVVAFDPYSATNLGLSVLPSSGKVLYDGAGVGAVTLSGVPGAIYADVQAVSGNQTAAGELLTLVSNYNAGALAATVLGVATGGITAASLAADTGLKPIRTGTAQAGASNTLTLDAAANALDNFYTQHLLVLTGGTGAGQARTVIGYVGATKVATIGGGGWSTPPDATTTFAVLSADKAQVLGGLALADVRAVYGDATNAPPNMAAVFAASGKLTGNLTGKVLGSGLTAFSGTGVQAALPAGAIDATVAPNLDAAVSSRAAPGDAMALTAGERSTLTAAVVDQTLAGHTTAGTVGGALNASGAAGDPWSTLLPGTYPAGTAGYIVGHQAAGVVDARLVADGLDAVLVATGLSPTGRITTPDGQPLVTLNARQALAILLAAEAGDRTGIGTKEIVAALAGATDGTKVTADRVSKAAINGSVVAPH